MSTTSNAPSLPPPVSLPPHLAARMFEDDARFGTNQTKEELDMEIEAANERRSALEKQKSEQGRAEVDHAKAVAAKVHAAHEGGATLSPPDLESSVAAKRASVDKQQAELDDIEARLAAADAREAALKAALGL